MPPAKAARSRYKPHPILGTEQRFRKRVEADTGKPWAHWVAQARKKAASSDDLERWLQEEHRLPPMASQWLAYEATHDEAAEYGEPEPLVDALYSGEHRALRPVHEAIVDAVLGLGDDVTVTACKTMVPVYRKHVFAEMRPGDGAVELRLALGDVAAKGRLKARSNPMPGERLTHRVQVRTAREVDAELRRWLAAAYAKGAGKMARSTEFEVPADFTKALCRSPHASATWASMTPSMQRDMVLWVTSAKQKDTRSRRLRASLERLAAGKKRAY